MRSGFAHPDVHEHLEAESPKYAVRCRETATWTDGLAIWRTLRSRVRRAKRGFPMQTSLIKPEVGTSSAA